MSRTASATAPTRHVRGVPEVSLRAIDATHRSTPPQEEECDVPPKYKELMDRIIQKKPKPKSPTVTVVDSEGSFEEYIGRPL